MKCILIGISIVLLCLTSHASAQEGWEPCNGDEIRFGEIRCMVPLPEGRLIVGAPTGIAGLFRSKNYAQGWERLHLQWPAYALAKDSANAVYAGTDHGLFRTTDGGDNWLHVDGTLGNSLITAIAVSPDQTIYVAAAGQSIFRSVDNGGSWIDVSAALKPAIIQTVMSTTSTVVVGTLNGVFVSKNQGATWTNTSIRDAHALAVAHNGMMYFVGASVFYRSADEGATWEFHRVLDEFDIPTIETIGVDADDHVYVSTSKDGMYRSTDNGTTWEKISNSLITCFAEAEASHLYYGFKSSGYGAVAHSSDNGTTWQVEAEGLSSASISHLYVDPDQSLIALTSRGLYRTRTKGASWERLAPDVFRESAELYHRTPTGAMIVAIGTDLYRSSDNGKSWSLQRSGLPSYIPLSVADIASTQDGSVFVAVASRVYDSSSRYLSVYRSTNDGLTWDSISSIENLGLDIRPTPRTSFESFRNMIAVGDELYISTAEGKAADGSGSAIFRSTDHGVTFIGSNIALIDISEIYTDVSFNPYTQLLMAGNYRSTDHGISWFRRAPHENYVSEKFAFFGTGLRSVSGPGYLFTVGDFRNEGDAYYSLDDGINWIPCGAGGDWFQTLAMDSSGVIFGAGIYGNGVYRRISPVLSVKHNIPSPTPSHPLIDDFLVLMDVNEPVIVDLLGRTVYCPSTHQSEDWRVDVRSLPEGIYFVRTKSHASSFCVMHRR